MRKLVKILFITILMFQIQGANAASEITGPDAIALCQSEFSRRTENATEIGPNASISWGKDFAILSKGTNIDKPKWFVGVIGLMDMSDRGLVMRKAICSVWTEAYQVADDMAYLNVDDFRYLPVGSPFPK